MNTKIGRVVAAILLSLFVLPSAWAEKSQALIEWETGTTAMNAESIQITVGKRVFGTPKKLQSLRSAPGDSSFTTLEVIWMDKKTEMRLSIDLESDGRNWWPSSIQTYDTSEEWVVFEGEPFRKQVGVSFEGDLSLESTSEDGAPVTLAIRGLRLFIKSFAEPKAINPFLPSTPRNGHEKSNCPEISGEWICREPSLEGGRDVPLSVVVRNTAYAFRSHHEEWEVLADGLWHRVEEGAAPEIVDSRYRGACVKNQTLENEVIAWTTEGDENNYRTRYTLMPDGSLERAHQAAFGGDAGPEEKSICVRN